MKEEGWIYKMPTIVDQDYSLENLSAEFGSTGSVQFAEAKVYDASGNEIETPKCASCGCYKNLLMSRDTFCYICPYCPGTSADV